MCKEDVRIKRQTAVNSVRGALNNGSVTQFLPSNPMRAALVISFSSGTVGGSTVYSAVLAGTSVTDPVIGVLNITNQSIVLTIEQIGILLTYPISITTNDASNYTVTVTEVYWTEALKDL